MPISRRDLPFLLPLFTAIRAGAQSATLPSKVYPFEEREPVVPGTHMHPVFNGELHSGFAVELHDTELLTGEAPHPPHRHTHEELILIRQGTIEVTIEGKSTKLGPGSVGFVASNQHHGWRNVGTETARYFVVALGPDRAYRMNPSGVPR